MSDLIERLRAVSDLSDWANRVWDIPGSATAKLRDLAHEAADEITRLRAELTNAKGMLGVISAAADGYKLRAERAEAELDQLREFVAALFEAIDWPESGDLDGFTFEELCEAHGILLPETRTEPCREGCWCDEYHGGAEGMADGVICFRKPQWLIDAARKR